MKYIFALGFSAVLLLGIIIGTEVMLIIRGFFHGEDPKERRHKEYQMVLIIWSLVTIAIFIMFIFFID